MPALKVNVLPAVGKGGKRETPRSGYGRRVPQPAGRQLPLIPPWLSEQPRLMAFALRLVRTTEAWALVLSPTAPSHTGRGPLSHWDRHRPMPPTYSHTPKCILPAMPRAHFPHIAPGPSHSPSATAQPVHETPPVLSFTSLLIPPLPLGPDPAPHLHPRRASSANAFPTCSRPLPSLPPAIASREPSVERPRRRKMNGPVFRKQLQIPGGCPARPGAGSLPTSTTH